jgi:hypothetical protein
MDSGMTLNAQASGIVNSVTARSLLKNENGKSNV